ncbi:MAG: hypothetical protein R6U27_10520, partial [Desulfobacterales bacterium]
NIFAWVDGDTVHTQSKFSGGKMVIGGQVNVYDSKGSLLLTGNTDDKGEFSFQIPQRTTLKVELQAGMGHKNEWIIKEDEIEGISKNDGEKISEQPEIPVNASEKNQVLVGSTGLTRQEIEKIVEEAVEKKLKPVVRMLSDQKESGPGISEIFGGIGYIIGLAGVAAYFKSRKKLEVDSR